MVNRKRIFFFLQKDRNFNSSFGRNNQKRQFLPWFLPKEGLSAGYQADYLHTVGKRNLQKEQVSAERQGGPSGRGQAFVDIESALL